jgi:predicted Zn finger-like uncharacterized protein
MSSNGHAGSTAIREYRMRIVCPSCQATYEVPDAAFAGGPRAVRCARCNTEWVPEAPAVAAPTAPPTPEPEADEALEADTESPPFRQEPRLTGYRQPILERDDDEIPPPQDFETARSRRGAIIGWVASLVLLAAIGWAAVSWRGQVMAAWPPSERVYGALGLR